MTTNEIPGAEQREYIGARVMQIIKHYGLNRNSFSLKIGLTSNSLITRITKDPEMGMSLGLIQKILTSFTEINPGWFILGEGEMFKKDLSRDPKLPSIKYCKEIGEEPVAQLKILGYEDCDLAFDVIGSGMDPKYRAGDVIICKTVGKNEKIQFGEAYLIVYDNKPMIRYIKSTGDDSIYKLGAEDPRFEDSMIKINDVQALYLVKGLIRKEVF